MDKKIIEILLLKYSEFVKIMKMLLWVIFDFDLWWTVEFVQFQLFS